jgi:hypothetical protein
MHFDTVVAIQVERAAKVAHGELTNTEKPHEDIP